MTQIILYIAVWAVLFVGFIGAFAALTSVL